MKSIRKHILETAHIYFMKYGYQETSTRDIARDLEITQPAIYHYFKSKEILYFEVLNDFAIKIGDDLRIIAENSSMDLNTHLKSMSLFIQEKHPMNFNLLIHDMESLKSQSMRDTLYLVWQENYFQPFFNLFHHHENLLRDDLTINQIVYQFLRILSTYITSVPTKNDQDNLCWIIDVFVRGITLS